MYSYLVDGGKESKRAKGIQRAVVEHELRHQHYKDQLAVPTENLLVNHRIQSKLHELYSVEMRKRGLCAFDDKRFLLPDNTTLAFGHTRIPHTVIDNPAIDYNLVHPYEDGLSDEQLLAEGLIEELMYDELGADSNNLHPYEDGLSDEQLLAEGLIEELMYEEELSDEQLLAEGEILQRTYEELNPEGIN